ITTAARHGHQPPTAGQPQLPGHGALRAQPDAVRGVLHIASDDHPAVVDQCGHSHLQARVRAVGQFGGLDRRGPQVGPIHLHRHDLMSGTPLAAGGRIFPTTPATARIVNRYGVIAISSLGIGKPIMPSTLCRLSANPISSAAKTAPIGVHRPMIIAASAMKPAPAVISLLKMPCWASVKNAPPKPAMAPPISTLRNRTELTSMP